MLQPAAQGRIGVQGCADAVAASDLHEIGRLLKVVAADAGRRLLRIAAAAARRMQLDSQLRCIVYGT